MLCDRNPFNAILALLLLTSPLLLSGQVTDADLHRAVQGAIKLRKLLKTPDNFVLDSVLLAHGKHGNDVCYSFHSRSAWDFIGRTFSSTGGEEVKTAHLTTDDTLRVWPPNRGRSPCKSLDKNPGIDITKEVREAGGFLP